MESNQICTPPIPTYPPLRNVDNSWVINDIDKANNLAQHLENSFSPHDIQPSPTQQNTVEDYLISPLPMSLPAKTTSPDEINTIIKKIPRSRSNHELHRKNLPRNIIIYFCHLFNAILRLSYFPSAQKHSIVILILKPNKTHENPASYRPRRCLPPEKS